MPKRTRSEIETDKVKYKSLIERGAKSLGRSNQMDVVVEILLDIRDALEDIKANQT